MVTLRVLTRREYKGKFRSTGIVLFFDPGGGYLAVWFGKKVTEVYNYDLCYVLYILFQYKVY